MLQYIDEVLSRSVLPKWLLTGAYGRHYSNIEEAKEDFISGKDFMMYQGPYCSIRDWTGEEVYVYCAGKFVKLSMNKNEYKTK